MKTIEIYNVLKDWTVTEKRSPFVGTHQNGIVQIPVGEFSDEQMQAWIDDGVLEFVEEREVEDNTNANSIPGVGKKVVMEAETGKIGAEGSEAGMDSNQG